jgi:hypothetical protein
MNNIQKRLLFFLIGCIGMRTAFVIIAKQISLDYLPFLGYLAILPALGFTYIFITGSRTTGPEVMGEKIWWNGLRPIHAILYGTFAYLAINKNPNAWRVLLLDVIIGLIAFLVHHYNAGSFGQL